MPSSYKMTTLECLFLIFLLTLSLRVEIITGDARATTKEIRCAATQQTNTSVFGPNFIASMENIGVQIRTTGFALTSVGSGIDASYALAQCYGDLSLLDCVLCYAEARTLLPNCYPHNGGRIFLDGCFMRSQNFSFFEEFTGPNDKAICGNSTRKSERFNESARQAVLQAAAAAPNNNGYARAQALVPGPLNESAYVLANCWRTLNASSCSACLQNASASILRCLTWSEGRALNTGCFMRYSDQNFLNKVPSNGRSKGRTIVMVVAILSSAFVGILGTTIGVYLWKNKQLEKKRRGSNDAVKMAKILIDSNLNFKYSTLEKATESFDKAKQIGQGGFGTVYKGVLADGREVAVKRLFFNNRHRAADFYNEVNMISSVEHNNLVRLLGCSCSGPESLLVYEFLPNKSLDRFIFDPIRGKALYWEKRFEIILGTAEGLAYLHENSNNRIIHRDIKASNILLDSRLRAKIADFGLARSFQEDKSHISTAIAGTLGYLAPEYLARGQLTEKADVYSFGVLLLEIVTGRQNTRSITSDFTDSLVTEAWKHFKLGTVEELYDPNLLLYDKDTIHVKNEMFRVVHMGFLCMQEIASLRPSMSRTLKYLINKDEQLPAPANPPFIDEKTLELNGITEDPCSLLIHLELQQHPLAHSIPGDLKSNRR